MPAIKLLSTTVNSNLIQKRSTSSGDQQGSIFAVHTEHTPAFNTVHIIAAAIGIIGVITLVTITLFIIYKKRKKNNNDNNNKTHTNDNNNNNNNNNNNSTRFGLFENDFNNNIEPPKPAIIHIEDASPMMQQYQLQLKLHQYNHSPTSSSLPSPPPPPYQP